MSTQETHYRACHLCEAICGVEIKTAGDQILSIKGDKSDPFSRGHICPKATALQDIHTDPDRLKFPVKKFIDADGQVDWQSISWEQAFQEIAERTASIQSEYGNNSVGVYAGNPNVHNYGNLTHGRVLRKALATKNNYSATSLDQLPHQLAALKLYGHQFLIPVPDIDHTNYMVIIGGNPIASNGSMMTVPDVKKRLKDIQSRGGEFVVIDPRRTETAAIADQHLFIRPGTDAYMLLGIINYLFQQKLVQSSHIDENLVNLDKLQSLVSPFTLELAASKTGVEPEAIKAIASKLALTERAVCYGRMGVSTQAHGALCQWAIQVINLLCGNVDVVGGALPSSSAVAYVKPGEPGAGHFDLYRSRVSKLPEFGGEFPSTVLAEEIETEGEGQIKALFTLAGNPVSSAPNGKRIDRALKSLALMVSVDIYINETTRNADYILPSTTALEHDHYDIAFHRLAVRNTARFNEALFTPADGMKHDWEILNGLACEIAKAKGLEIKPMPSPDQIIDFGLQTGPYGKAAGHKSELSLAKLKANPHGVDLGPLTPSLKERLCTENSEIDLVPEFVVSGIDHLNLDNMKEQEGLLLIGRRHVRTNNSWMNNSHRLVKGKPRWLCLMHPKDMADRGISDGALALVKTRVGEVQTQIEESNEMMPGVISIPHGWGQGQDHIRLSIATKQGGVSANDLTDDALYDKASGNAVLNGVPAEVSVV